MKWGQFSNPVESPKRHFDVVAVSGIRDLSPEQYVDVELEMAEVLAVGPDEVRFGGALGSDTIALVTACDLREVETALTVIVPGTLDQQPVEARKVAKKCADRVIELGASRLDAPAFYRRNDALLQGADVLVAFTDGRTTGGTAYTIRKAEQLGVPSLITLLSPKASREPNPLLRITKARAPIHAVRQYVSKVKTGRTEWASEAIRQLKTASATTRAIDRLSVEVARYIERAPELRDVEVIVPMPRRVPDQPSDLLPLAEKVAEMTGQRVASWLTRLDEPAGKLLLGRVRSVPEEHARSLQFVGPRTRVIVFDNVITTSGTMLGAQLAVERDSGIAPYGLAVLYSTEFA